MERWPLPSPPFRSPSRWAPSAGVPGPRAGRCHGRGHTTPGGLRSSPGRCAMRRGQRSRGRPSRWSGTPDTARPQPAGTAASACRWRVARLLTAVLSEGRFYFRAAAGPVPWNDIGPGRYGDLVSADPAATVVQFGGSAATVATHRSTEVSDFPAPAPRPWSSPGIPGRTSRKGRQQDPGAQEHHRPGDRVHDAGGHARQAAADFGFHLVRGTAGGRGRAGRSSTSRWPSGWRTSWAFRWGKSCRSATTTATGPSGCR